MSKTFVEMQDMYREIVKRFNKIELQDWKAEGAMIELSKQVGELAKQVMVKEKYFLWGNNPDFWEIFFIWEFILPKAQELGEVKFKLKESYGQRTRTYSRRRPRHTSLSFDQGSFKAGSSCGWKVSLN